MKVANSTMVIIYPNGAQQVVKPGPSFQGNWDQLAEAIAGAYFPANQKVNYKLK